MKAVAGIWREGGQRMLLFKWILCVMLLAQMALCPRLWLAKRSFPTVPVLDFLPDLPQWTTLGLSCLLVASVIAILALPKPRVALYCALSFGCLLVLFDINRLQPWFYQCLVLFAALSWVDWDGLDSRRTQEAWSICGFFMVALYFWSGVQKANLMFATVVFPWLAHAAHLDSLTSLWFLAPLFEALVGLALLFPKTRTIGLVGLTGMHLFLLAVLGPLGMGYNSVVWPWNFAMPLLAFALFFRNPDSIWQGWRPALGKVAFVMLGFFPLLNFVGWWDDYLSAGLFSGTAREGYIVLSSAGVAALPGDVRSSVQVSENRNVLETTNWAMEDLNVPPYPETRVYAAVARKLGVSARDLRLLVTDRPRLLDVKARLKVISIR